ncbi:hypothetical protein R9C00_08370 [Flammeovirgaceae bacterium SG7u.111]|nr:hypothetical protein [Flammeovirgaceae bacterium SG7u.132]WPO37461.1 hypothetical protein R9C00_08370 [Flammeovirgaceae bacterium SG7u.111]
MKLHYYLWSTLLAMLLFACSPQEYEPAEDLVEFTFTVDPTFLDFESTPLPNGRTAGAPDFTEEFQLNWYVDYFRTGVVTLGGEKGNTFKLYIPSGSQTIIFTYPGSPPPTQGGGIMFKVQAFHAQPIFFSILKLDAPDNGGAAEVELRRFGHEIEIELPLIGKYYNVSNVKFGLSIVEGEASMVGYTPNGAFKLHDIYPPYDGVSADYTEVTKDEVSDEVRFYLSPMFNDVSGEVNFELSILNLEDSLLNSFPFTLPLDKPDYMPTLWSTVLDHDKSLGSTIEISFKDSLQNKGFELEYE